MEWWQWAMLVAAAFIVGVSKTGIAGFGIFAVALFATALPARSAVGAVLLVLIAGDIVAVNAYRRDANWSYLWRLFPWTAAGVVLGALALGRIDDRGLGRLLGAILLLLVLLSAWRRWSLAHGGRENPLPHWMVAPTGVTAGFTTMVANASGPIMILYLLEQNLPKIVFMGTTAWFYLFLNLFKVPFSYALGMINASSLPISLVLIPFAVLGALVGRPILRRLDQRWFEILALVFTFIAALRLVMI
jgi:hypothetical protein